MLVTFWLRFKSGYFENLDTPSAISLVYMGIALTLFWIVVYIFRCLYLNQYSTSRYEAFAEVTKTGVIGLIILFLLFFDYAYRISTTRLILFFYVGLVILFSGAGRVIFREWIRTVFKRQENQYNSIIIGFGERGKKLYDTLQIAPAFGYGVKHIVTVEEDETAPEGIPSSPLSDLEAVLDDSETDCEVVLITVEPTNYELVLKIIDKAARYPVRIMIIPSFFQILTGLIRSQQLYGVPLIEVFPELLPPFDRVVKRMIDILVSFTTLVAGSPLFVMIALAVKLSSKGPAIYKQKRMGYRGKPFTMYKFRTMYEDAEDKSGPVWAKEDDPRITKVGKFLRRTRLDELPQMWCVLIGTMSLVGPRPERKPFVDQFVDLIPFYVRRLNVKPGVTGWAQVRRGYDASLEDVKEKLQYDLFYLENISIGLDIKIIANTFWVMLTSKGH